MANIVDKVIKIAENEVGYLEKKSNSQLDDKTANAGKNNYTKYWRDIAPGMQGQSWCNCFVNWCFYKAYGETIAKKLLCTDGAWSYYTPTSAGYFKNKKQWYASNPKKGDVIYFKNSTRIHHVGIVYKVDSSKVYTIEGNTSAGSAVIANGGGVARKSYSIKNSSIVGYGRPKYDTSTTSSTSTVTTTISNNTATSSSNTVLITVIKKAQEQSNKFTGISIIADGVRGTNTKKQAVRVLQTALNKDYKSKLTVDGVYGSNTKKALGSHYVKYGEKQYMVSAAEILLGLLGKDPSGYEYPGVFGNGLKKASGKDKITASDFISYLS